MCPEAVSISTKPEILRQAFEAVRVPAVASSAPFCVDGGKAAPESFAHGRTRFAVGYFLIDGEREIRLDLSFKTTLGELEEVGGLAEGIFFDLSPGLTKLIPPAEAVDPDQVIDVKSIPDQRVRHEARF